MSRSTEPNAPASRFVDDLGDYLSVDELAQYLQLSKETIYHWRLEGSGPKATKLGKHLRYSCETCWPGWGLSDERWIWSGAFQLMRPSKVIANAFSAGFHLVTQRARPRPVGSSERVTR
ncbi:helix-turn-helix domain-containing protein [Agromyces larvae]|uniref:helix-turn-helix domain-containing protein n=1 Tax=Agromyces larvae TaxID=2929802 RepID=UPI00338FFC82